MNLERAKNEIRRCAEHMDARYGGVVFDEWAVVSFARRKLRVFEYIGRRRDDFGKRFLADAGELRASLLSEGQQPGDFGFSYTGAMTGFESFIVLGRGMYLIWNNTAKSMDMITSNPRWLAAQVPFADLTDRFRGDPLDATFRPSRAH